MNLWKRTEDRHKAATSALETFRAAIGKAVSEADFQGVLALHIHRHLDSVAREYEHRAALRNMALGGR
jgi:hypothetical protein